MSTIGTYSCHFAGEEKIPSPALVYYKDIIEENTRRAIQEAGDAARLWPHVKSHKMAEIIRMQLRMGIRRFKCATIAEAQMTAAVAAEVMAEETADCHGAHILLAYPIVGPNQERLLELIRRWPQCRFYALSDDVGQMKLLSEKAAAAQMEISVFIDVNAGMNRTGVPIAELTSFCRQAAEIKPLRIAGFHVYDGNRHEKDYDERLAKVQETLREVRGVLPEDASVDIIFGGSPSFPCYTQELPEEEFTVADHGFGENVHCYFAPGTVFIYDIGYTEQFPDLLYKPGAAVLTRVVSHPAEGYFTVDAGYKSISAEQIVPGVLQGVPHAKAAFQSEEHWTFTMEEGHEDERPAIGEILYILPWHICPTTAMYDHVFVADHGTLTDVWEVTARDRLPDYKEVLK